MTKTFTQNDILRFLYGEMNEKESEEFQDCLKTDSQLKEQYTDQINILNLLEASLIQPSDKVIKSISEYSRSYRLPLERA